MAHGQNIVARLQQATKNATATLMLMRLNHWLAKPVAVQIDGEPWVANSIEEWGDDAGLTTTQAKYAGEQLRKSNLMKTTMRYHRKRWIMHATTTARARAIIAGAEDDCPQDEGTDEPKGGAAAPVLIEEQIEKQIGKQIIKDSGTTPKGVVPPSFQELETEAGEDKKETEMKMSDAAKAAAGAKLLHKLDSVKALEFIWKQKLHEITGATIVLTKKEYGQLKQFQLKTPGQSQAVLAAVLGNWLHFAHQVAADAGLKNVPEKPRLDFLLLYASNAVMQQAKTKATQHEAAPAMIATKTVQSIATKPGKPNYANLAEKLKAENPDKTYPTFAEIHDKPSEES